MLLVLRVTLAARPWCALSAGYVGGATALALLAAWTLASANWSDAPARAIIEYDRVLLYLLGFVVVGALGRTVERLRWVVRGIAAAAFGVCMCGLVTWLAPDVWPVDPTLAGERLSYPVGYWNALGLVAAIGSVMSFALTSDDREAPAARALAAAALPVLGVTLLLTFSRGAIAAGAIGLILLIVTGRPRALLSALIVVVPTVGLAVASAYGADLLATQDATPAANAQGHDVAFVVVLCCLIAAVARVALLPLDRRMQLLVLPPVLRSPATRWAAAAVVAASALIVSLVLGAPGLISHQYDRFLNADSSTLPGDRARLSNAGNNGRVDQWRVALDAFQREPVQGQGAGTYALEWDRHRPQIYQVEDGHSLYLEVLGELGVVGLVLVLAAIILVLGGFAARARGPDRVVGGALFGAGLAWAVHAGIDWHWEMPVVTLWFFAAGGLALAARADRAGGAPSGPIGRAVAVAVCIALAVLPVRIFLSERSLRESARAFAAGDCATAVDRALDSAAALRARPEPFIVLGYCNVRLGQNALAVRAMRNAVDKDPDNWEGHYALALAQAAAGEDPRPSLRDARRLNPKSPLVFETTQLLGDDPAAWRTRASRARLPTD
ncbi:MAG TPA: O-antigen ligase family protein [Solirubrobacteraceae bacterium]|nr:O-antigen ligase family protein [Solirubrobacteraceae bacterium]